MGDAKIQWNFRPNDGLDITATTIVRGVVYKLRENLNPYDPREVVALAQGDPAQFPSLRTAIEAQEAIVEALRSTNYNTYPPGVGILRARRAVADYLSQDLPHKLSPDDVFLAVGGTQAIEIIMTVLARPGANTLLPRPGYAHYDGRAKHSNIEIRHYDLLPEKSWETDLDAVEALADENTVAIVVINPGNPCGNVSSYRHLEKVAETARKLGILVVSDEVYQHIVFGSTPFTPMGLFGATVPVVTIGSISKRWSVPGWRLGWLVTNDPNLILQKSGIINCIKGCLEITTDPPTFIQGAIPQILERTKEEFFSGMNNILRQAADICFNRIREIPCIICPSKPEGAMFVMVKLNVSLLEGIEDDMDFCLKLVKEESVMVLPGITLGMKNWLRLTFATELSSLEDGLARIKTFCQRHANQEQV